MTLSNHQPLALYVHWPFCKAKCPYCDFNVHVRDEVDHARWAGAFERALNNYAALLPGRRLASVFFGGGTPSLMAPETVRAVLETAHNLWPADAGCEVTLEANPTSIETEKLKSFEEAGINRVSIGIQALKDADLQFLGRKHSVKEALQALDVAKNIFDRVSFDLIYARPGQTLAAWEEELRYASGLAAGHLSLYQLTIERNTPFYFMQEQGQFSIPKEDLASDFYHLTQDILAGAGLPAYEVSNHAAPGQESRHNLTYWHYGEYIGIGPGAHGRIHVGGQRCATRDHSAPDIWLERVEASGTGAHPFEALSPAAAFTEGLMMGLRLTKGLDLQRLSDITGAPWEDMIDPARLGALQNEGYLNQNAAHVTLTREGLLRLNGIAPFVLR